MSDEKLLPCPFCGGEPELHWINEVGEVLTAWVRCKCGCEHHERLTKEVAVKKWNSRHLPNDAQTSGDCGVTDTMCEAAIKADQIDRIQGFSYNTDHVIRDVWKSPGDQVIWRLSKEIPGAEESFYRQCRIEKMRKVLEAALKVSSTDRA